MIGKAVSVKSIAKSPNDAFTSKLIEQEAERAKAVVQAVYPEANVFDVYNVVDEKTEPDSVLEFVVGSSATEVLVDGNPIVMWNFRNSKAAEWKERKLAREHEQLRGGSNHDE